MPARDPSDNTVILYLQLGKWDPVEYSMHQVFRTIVFVQEIMLLRFQNSHRTFIESFFSDAVQINGIKLLGDASEASMEHFKAMDRRAINLWGNATGKTIPLRLKKICMYNVSIFQPTQLADIIISFRRF